MKRLFLIGVLGMVMGVSGAGAGRAAAEVNTAAAPAAGNGLLSQDEIKKLMEAGQYQDAMKALVRVLNLTGPAAAPYNRHEILMMKADCQIQLRQQAAAIGTATMAKKEAEQAHHADDEKEAAAMLLLLQRSPGGQYTPMTAEVKTPIKLTDRAKREDAYKALYADAKEMFRRKAAAAEKGPGLPPYLELAKMAETLRTAEYGATKGTTETDEAMKDVADHAAKLVDAALTDLQTKTDRISEEASRVVTETSTMTDRTGRQFPTQITHRQGLMGTDGRDLDNIEATCKKISSAMADFVKGFPEQADEFKKLASRALDLSAKADRTLHTDYTQL